MYFRPKNSDDVAHCSLFMLWDDKMRWDGKWRAISCFDVFEETSAEIVYVLVCYVRWFSIVFIHCYSRCPLKLNESLGWQRRGHGSPQINILYIRV